MMPNAKNASRISVAGILLLLAALGVVHQHEQNDRGRELDNVHGSDVALRRNLKSVDDGEQERRFLADGKPAKSGSKNEASLPTRAFPTWEDETKGKPLPCVLDGPEIYPYSFSYQMKFTYMGLLFTKIPKTASSTFAGVATRIAHVVYRRMEEADKIRPDTNTSDKDNGVCRFRGPVHEWQRRGGVDLRKRLKDRSFLWTVVRNPSDRLISQYFHFHVARAGASTEDNDIINTVERPLWANLQLRHVLPYRQTEFQELQGKTSEDASLADEWNPIIDEVLQEYNFIGVLERMEETLAVLQLIMGLETGDVVPLPAKQSGKTNEFDFNRHGECNKFVKPFRTDAIQEYLTSNHFYKRHEGDFLLHDAANRSLDATIEALGKDRVDEAIARLREAMALAKENGCEDRSPCKEEGVAHSEATRKQMCYMGDTGCGHKCLDSLFGPK